MFPTPVGNIFPALLTSRVGGMYFTTLSLTVGIIIVMKEIILHFVNYADINSHLSVTQPIILVSTYN